MSGSASRRPPLRAGGRNSIWGCFCEVAGIAENRNFRRACNRLRACCRRGYVVKGMPSSCKYAICTRPTDAFQKYTQPEKGVRENSGMREREVSSGKSCSVQQRPQLLARTTHRGIKKPKTQWPLTAATKPYDDKCTQLRLHNSPSRGCSGRG